MPDTDQKPAPDEFFLLWVLIAQNNERRAILCTDKRERERFGAYLWKVRGSVLKDLGIPEWQLNLSLMRETDEPDGKA